MVVLLLQVVMAFVKLLAGIVILSVGLRDLHASGLHRLAWQLTGYAFVLGGSNAVIQIGVFAPWAFFAGEGTAVYAGFLRSNPAVTQSRTFLMIGFGILLVLLPILGKNTPSKVPSVGIVSLVLAMVAGGVRGWFDGGYESSRFFSSAATTNLLELILLLVALLVAITKDTMDWHLWIALAVYSLSIGLNVISYTALAWVRVEGAWAPSPIFVQSSLILAHATMAGLAIRRLQLARRGVTVRALFDSAARAPRSAFP